MAIFNRRNDNQVPSELEPYYDGPKWHVWVRRAVYVLLVLLVLVGIFLLGRAVYRSVTNNDSDNDTAQTQEQRENNDAKSAEEKATQSNNDTQGQSGGQNNSGQSGNTGVSDGQGGANTTTPNAIPRTGDDPTDQPPALPATGG